MVSGEYWKYWKELFVKHVTNKRKKEGLKKNLNYFGIAFLNSSGLPLAAVKSTG